VYMPDNTMNPFTVPAAQSRQPNTAIGVTYIGRLTGCPEQMSEEERPWYPTGRWTLEWGQEAT
jgi:hypothetical protein